MMLFKAKELLYKLTVDNDQDLEVVLQTYCQAITPGIGEYIHIHYRQLFSTRSSAEYTLLL